MTEIRRSIEEVDPDAHPEPVRVATRRCHAKPMAALFKAIEISVYREFDVELPGPTLDLGCGDAAIARMLREMGMLDGSARGLDLSPRLLKMAASEGVHDGLVRGDANALPFSAGSFASALISVVLASIPGDVHRPLREVARVLRPGGAVVATVVTDRFHDTLLVPKIIGRVTASGRRRYLRKLDARMPHYHYYSAHEWVGLFEESGLEVVRRVGFFGPELGRLWSVFCAQAFRVFAGLRLVKSEKVRELVGGRLAGVLGPMIRREIASLHDGKREDLGFVLIVARKPEGTV